MNTLIILPSVQIREKRSETESIIACLTIAKQYINGIAWLDLLDERMAAYMLDYKTAGRLYLRIFFNLSEAVCQNFSCIYNKSSKQNIIILDHKIYIPLNLIH